MYRGLIHLLHKEIKSQEEVSLSSLSELVETPSSLDSSDENGWASIHWAIHYGKHLTLKNLLAAGADPNASTKTGDSALHLAIKNGDQFSFLPLLELLSFEKEPVIISCRNWLGDTPMHFVMRSKTLPPLEMITMMLKKEIQHSTNDYAWSLLWKNKNGETPLQIAESQQNTQLLSLFRTFLPKIFPQNLTFDLQICSDLHVEFRNYDTSTAIIPKERYLALLGDIGVVNKKKEEKGYCKFIASQAEKFEKVFIITGNHEYYGNTIEEAENVISEVCDSHPNLEFLNKRSLLVDGVRILGVTLWSHIDVQNKKFYEWYVSDYKQIRNPSNSNRPFSIEDTNNLHNDHVNFLKEEIQKAKENSEPVIIFTHHAPSTRFGCNHPQYSSFLNCSCTELSELFGPPVKVWCYGHTHWFKDFTVKGTRVVTNPKGYVHEKTNYDPSFMVSVVVGEAH